MNARLKMLRDCLLSIPQANYPFHSRVHLLRSFQFPSVNCYVKREDELGFGLSGSKVRKYRSLLPFLIVNGFQEVILIGSAYSNHILSLIQLLIENGLQPTLFLRGDPYRPLQGNALLTSLFIPSSSIHWFSKEEWKNVEWQAHVYVKHQKHPVFILPEGGFCFEALPGALTLALDLLENEKEQALTFDHLLIEAGTGFTASSLILGLSWLEHPVCIHVILLAEDENSFLDRLKDCHIMCMQLLGVSFPFPCNFILHLPKETGRFGQIHPTIFKNIAQIAQKEGFLTDPIYSAKLFIESQQLLAKKIMHGNVLIHHSGGALTLMGFQGQLAKI